MGGEWRESENRSFEVEVDDDTEYVTFRRLIKLCYGSTFIKEGDRDLDVSELVRLIHVANAFECMDAVKQCLVALQVVELDWEGAVQCIELTEMLKGVEGMGDLAKRAADVLAEEVGAVHELFTPVEEKNAKDGGDILGGLRLSAKVKDLSPTVFEALLSSDNLQLQTANEAFWLLLSWVEAQSEESEEGKQELFTRMAKHLRFHSMDPGYILLLVSKHPRIIAAGLQTQVLMKALTRSNLARRTGDEVKHFHYYGPSMPPLTRPGQEVTWSLSPSFTRAETAGIKPSFVYRKVVGLVAGLPWYIGVSLYRKATGETEAKVLTACKMPFNWMTYKDGEGFYFTCKLKVGLGTPRVVTLQNGYRSYWTRKWVCVGFLGLWDDVFREGSQWLVNGDLRMSLGVTISNDQGPSMSKAIDDEEDEEEEDD